MPTASLDGHGYDIDEPLLHLAMDIAGKLGNDSGNAVAAL